MLFNVSLLAFIPHLLMIIPSKLQSVVAFRKWNLFLGMLPSLVTSTVLIGPFRNKKELCNECSLVRIVLKELSTQCRFSRQYGQKLDERPCQKWFSMPPLFAFISNRPVTIIS